MPNWTSETDRLFYESIKRDYEGAKINEGNMSSILRRHRLFMDMGPVGEQTNNGEELQFTGLQELMDLLRDKGWQPAECGAIDFRKTRFIELEKLRANAADTGQNEIRSVFYQRIGELFASSDPTEQKIAGELVTWFKTTRWA